MIVSNRTGQIMSARTLVVWSKSTPSGQRNVTQGAEQNSLQRRKNRQDGKF